MPDTNPSVPVPVDVQNVEPLQVEIAAPARDAPIITASGLLSMPPTTTEQEDIVSAGQRTVNLIWENTQSRIALLVVVAGVFVNSVVVLFIIGVNREVSVTQLSLISICLQFINLTVGIVIGFYFSRTNHSATGGTGRKPDIPPYTGR